MNSKTDIDIVIRYLEHPDNEQHKRLLNEWIQQDPGNLDIFLDMRDMWHGDPLPAASAQDTEQQWQRLSAILDQTPATATTPAPAPQQGRIISLSRKYWWSAAAAIAIFAISWIWLGPGQYTTITTAQNQDSLHLPDGSMVYLNANTTLRYARNFGSSSRNIYIDKGEAFFDVTKDDTHPFTVDAPEVAIRVLGTSFNVKAANAGVKVFVQTGKVSAAYKGAEKNVILTPGVEASLKHQGTDIETRLHKKNNNVLAWRTRCLIFDESPLSEVAGALEDCYHIQVSINNPQLADRKLLATFRNMPLDEVLDIIKKTLQINISHKNNLVEIY
ncbi:FecR family protein [Chitinophaga vietnamensis]|uniref:FecR family protein n=1 Tax=Chitinophaga vietnamensis TaxID=2593957 RepID=UPI00117830C9|nr:FecR domain-containing protein [Chitinophaga vietnamensis]